MSGFGLPGIPPPILPKQPSRPRPVEKPRRLVNLSSVLPPIVQPSPKNRTVAPDLTGHWESLAFQGDTEAVSPVIVQISQAGGVAVLWFTRPPPGVEGIPRFTLPHAGAETADWVYGVASCVVRDINGADLLAGGSSMKWLAALQPTGPSINLDPFNAFDPSDLHRLPGTVSFATGTGKLARYEDGITLEFGGAARVKLTRLRPGARLPRFVLDTIPDPLHTVMMIESVRPLPEKLVRRMLSLFAPEWANGKPRMDDLLNRWYAKPKAGQGRDNPRTEIGKALSFGLDEPWRTTLLDRMALAARTNLKTLDDVTKPYAEWLLEVLAEEESSLTDHRKSDSRKVQDAIRALRPGSADTFAYTLTFTDAGAKGTVGGQRGTSRGIGVGGFVALVNVTKEALTLKRDGAGNVVYDDAGRAVVDPAGRRPVSWGNSSRLFGVLGRVETGLSRKDFVFPDPSPNPTKWYDRGATADLGTVEFRSSLDLDSTEAFDKALFTVASVVLGKAKWGNWIRAQIADSALWELRLADGNRMSAIVDGTRVKGPGTSNAGSMVSPSWWKDWKPTAIDVTAFRISVGYGMLLAPGSWGSYKENRPIQPRSSSRDLYAPLTAELRAFFEFDSFMLEDPKRPDTGPVPRRLLLEERIAEIRSVLALPGPPLLLIGMTSPEGDNDHNFILSYNRIRAIDRAIKDALGPIYARGEVIAEPLGEKPATATSPLVYRGVTVPCGNLPDPESFASRAAYFADAQRKRLAGRWPEWRRVNVYAGADLLISVYTKPDPTPSP